MADIRYFRDALAAVATARIPIRRYGEDLDYDLEKWGSVVTSLSGREVYVPQAALLVEGCFRFFKFIQFGDYANQRDAAVHPEYDTLHHQVTWRLARAYKKKYSKWWSHVNLAFLPFDDDSPYLALPGPIGISFSDKLVPAGIATLALHEEGHLVDFHLLTEEDREWFMARAGLTSWGNGERFADAFGSWVRSDGADWP